MANQGPPRSDSTATREARLCFAGDTMIEAIEEAFAKVREWGHRVETRLTALETQRERRLDILQRLDQAEARLGTHRDDLFTIRRTLEKLEAATLGKLEVVETQDRANPRVKLGPVQFSWLELQELVLAARLVNELHGNTFHSGTPYSPTLQQAEGRFSRALRVFDGVGRS
jgi:poly-D-alanine transfer protein DltD